MPYEVQEFKRACLVVAHEKRIGSGGTSDDFGATLQQQIDKDFKNLVVDLSEVDFFLTAGIRELITAMKHAREKGGDLVLCAPSEKVVDVLTIAGLLPIFKVYKDETTAVGSF